MKKTAFFFFNLLILFSSCIKEEIDANLLSTNIITSPTLAVPLGYLELSIDKYLSDSLFPEQLTQDATGFFTLMYHQKLYTLDGEEILKFDLPISSSNRFENNSALDINLGIIPSDLIYYDTLLLNLNFDNNSEARIDSIILQSMDIKLLVNSIFPINGELEIKIPQLKKNGQIYSKTTAINGFNTDAELINYKLSPIFRNDSNIVELIFKASLKNSPVIITAGSEFLNYQFSIESFDYSSIFGYLGIQNLAAEEQQFSLPFFEKLQDGVFHFVNPKLKIMFENSFGFPISIGFSKFEAVTRRNGTLQVNGSAFPDATNPFTIKFPSLQQLNMAIEDSLILGQQTTNLFEVLEALPTQFSFQTLAMSNFVSSPYNFISDSSKLSVDVILELPLYGYASYLSLQDTMEFTIDDFYNPEKQKIKKLSFTLDFTNSFPVEVWAQIYFVDENKVILDSMFDETFKLNGGIDMNNDGKTDPTISDVQIVELSNEKFERIKNTRYLLNKGIIQTANARNTPPENVKFYSDYSLLANLGAIFEFEELNISTK